MLKEIVLNNLAKHIYEIGYKQGFKDRKEKWQKRLYRQSPFEGWLLTWSDDGDEKGHCGLHFVHYTGRRLLGPYTSWEYDKHLYAEFKTEDLMQLLKPYLKGVKDG